PGRRGYGRTATRDDAACAAHRPVRPCPRHGTRHGRSSVKHRSLVGGLVAGAVSGGIATWLMDMVTTGIQQGQSRVDGQREKAAQANGKSSVENLLETAEATLGVRLDDSLRPIALQAIHYGLGIGPPALYGAL